MLILGVLATGCVASQAAEPMPTATLTATPTSTSSPAPTNTATATATPTATVTATAVPTAAWTPTSPPPPPPPPTPTPELISEVLPVVEPPQAAPAPVEVRGGTQLPVPDGTTVVWGGCASDGECYWFNFYWAPTHEVVMQNGEGQHKVQHEMCHAHQHWSINGGAPLAPSDYDLESWYSTAEGQSFTGAVAGLSWPWSHSQVNGLEDFAWTCAYWYIDPAYLLQVSSDRYAWAEANLP